MLSVGQIIKCKNSWGKWEKTSIIKIDEMDGVAYKWHCANGLSTCRPDWDFDWTGKPKSKTPLPYKPRAWKKGTTVKFMPYEPLKFKRVIGVIEEDYGDGFVLIKTSNKTVKVPEVNISEIIS